MWGLSFKPDTDDIREAPSLYMIEKLTDAGAEVIAFDPEAMSNVRDRLGHRIEFANNQYDALDNADCLVICTEWSVFRNPDFDRVAEALNNKVIFDGRNLYDNDKLEEAGFFYKSIGRETVNPKQD